MTSDLSDILKIYFDLTDRPNGAKLVSGELQVSEYVDTVILNTEKRIAELKENVEENKGKRFEGNWQRRLDDTLERLEKAKKYQESFHS